MACNKLKSKQNPPALLGVTFLAILIFAQAIYSADNTDQTELKSPEEACSAETKQDERTAKRLKAYYYIHGEILRTYGKSLDKEVTDKNGIQGDTECLAATKERHNIYEGEKKRFMNTQGNTLEACIELIDKETSENNEIQEAKKGCLAATKERQSNIYAAAQESYTHRNHDGTAFKIYRTSRDNELKAYNNLAKKIAESLHVESECYEIWKELVKKVLNYGFMDKEYAIIRSEIPKNKQLKQHLIESQESNSQVKPDQEQNPASSSQ